MAQSKSDTAHYFLANQSKFNVWGGLEDGTGLRECQLGAYWAVWSHFTASDEPALVSLPTGAGKTALMMALAFALGARRVLIITPAEVLRDQITREFASLDVLRRSGTLSKGVGVPKVYSNDKKLRTKAKWRALARYDVVAATPKTSSPAESGVCDPPPGLFDLVFLDEAHHTPAPTWSAILKAFKGTKCVLLTATPFRRDGRRIRAPLVYHYSIGRAIKKGIYQPVQYQTVRGGLFRHARDQALCEMAKTVLEAERNRGHHPRLLIRTDRVHMAERLAGLYEQHEIKVRAVDYEKSWNENQATIEAVRNGELDGMICVGMLGEGLDLPALKIAVLHDSPRSLPFTLQFIGRVSRTADELVGDACLIAARDEVSDEMKRLYKTETSWRNFIPSLVDQVVRRATEPQRLSSAHAFEELDVDLADLKPYFSLRIYTVDHEKIDLGREIELPEEIDIGFDRLDQGVRVLITETDEQPAWAKDTGIRQTQYDLHIYYCPGDKGFLFEATTSDVIAKRLRIALAGGPVDLIPPDEVMCALQGAKTGNYYMIGLKNAMGGGPAQPTYMVMMGEEVQAAVRPTDGRTFAPGHALVQLSKEETRGIATFHGRVWTLRRDDVSEFRRWCNKLADDLQHKPALPGLPQLDFLLFPRAVDKLWDKPLAIVLDDSLLRAIRTIGAEDQAHNIVRADIIPYVDIRSFGNGLLECEFFYHSQKPGVRIQYDASAIPVWKKVDSEYDVRIRLEFAAGDTFEGDLIDYLDEYPPSLIMPETGVVIGRQYWRPCQQLRAGLPGSCLQPVNWHRCEITNEARPAKKGHKNIHDWLESKLKKEISREAVLIKDHGRGEIADFVVVETQPENQIAFYHCKGMQSKKPGDNVTDAYEVLGQACRSGPWSRSANIINELAERRESRKTMFRVLKGAKKLDQLLKGFSWYNWRCRVVVVQPGFACDQITSTSKLMPLILTTYEWLGRNQAELVVWGS